MKLTISPYSVKWPYCPEMMTSEDLKALSALIYSHVNLMALLNWI